MIVTRYYIEILEPQHRFGYSFDQPVILFNDVVEVLALSDSYPPRFLCVVLLYGSIVGTTLIDINQTGLAAGANSFSGIA